MAAEYARRRHRQECLCYTLTRGPRRDPVVCRCLAPLGRVTQVTFPSTLTEGYTYDAMNNLLSKTDRKQQGEKGVKGRKVSGSAPG